MSIRIGKSGGRFLELSEELLHQGMCILGRTGQGKSRLLDNLAHECLVKGWGTFVLDPDGDLCDAIAARIARDVNITGNTSVLKRVHYLDLSFDRAWRYDPFQFQPIRPVHPELHRNAFECWRHCRVDAVGQILLRNQGEASFEGMPRLERVLTNVLNVLATEVDGKRLSLADASVVLDFGHPLSDRIWDRVAPHLPPEVRADFAVLRDFKRMEDFRKETESTVNRLRSMFGPCLKAIFSEPGRPSFSVYNAIQKGHMVLVNLRPSDYCSEKQAVALGRMLLYDIIATTTSTPLDLRKTSVTVIDEAATLLMPDIKPALRRNRKYRRGMVLASQELSSFRVSDDLDLTDVVLSQPHTLISFQQRLPKDLELLSRLFFTANLSFEELVHEVERDGGVEFLPIIERAWNTGRNTNRSRGKSLTDGEAETDGYTKTLGEVMGWADAHTASSGRSLSSAVNESEMERRLDPEDKGSLTRGKARTDARTDSAASTKTQNGSQSQTEALQKTLARQKSVGTQEGESEGESSGESWSLRYAQIQKVIRERQATGQLTRSVADQLEAFARDIFCLRRREAFVLMGFDVAKMETIEVPDPFACAITMVKVVKRVRNELRQVHDYLFTPDMSPEAEEARLLSLFTEVDEPASINENNPFDS